MRMISDILGPGAVFPMLRDSDGNDAGQLIVTGRLRSTQASTKSKLGVKEEAQRFLNVEDTKAKGGSVTATLTASVAYLRQPGRAVGAVTSIGAGGNVAATLSRRADALRATGSGDIRGMVIWGDSVLYLSDFEFTVQVVTPDARFPEPGRTRAGRSLSRPTISPPARSRWACAFPSCTRKVSRRCSSRRSRAARPDLPVDDLPHHDGQQGEPLYPPESMAANQGIGFAGVTYLQGGEGCCEN